MGTRKAETCVRCDGAIEINESAVVMFLYCQTVGIPKRQKSPAQRLYLCAKCAVVAAMGEKPKNGPLNSAAYNMVRHLVGQDPSVTSKAWEELHHNVVPGSRTLPAPEPEILPPARQQHTLRAVG